MKMRNALLLVLALLVAGATVGCSTNLAGLHEASNLTEFVAALKQITATDLDAATARATAGGDTLGAMCYPVIKKYVQQGVAGQQKLAGVFDAFEAARLGAKQALAAQIPQDLQIACSPLFMDQRDLALRIAALLRP